MANVEILLNLVQNVKKEIKETKSELQSLEQNIDANLDVDDNGTIQKTRAELSSLARDREINIQPELSRINTAKVRSQIASITDDQSIRINDIVFDSSLRGSKWRDSESGSVLSGDDIPQNVKDAVARSRAMTSRETRGKGYSDSKKDLMDWAGHNAATRKPKAEQEKMRDRATRAPMPNRGTDQWTELREEVTEQVKEAKKEFVHGGDGIRHQDKVGSNNFQATTRQTRRVGRPSLGDDRTLRNQMRDGQVNSEGISNLFEVRKGISQKAEKTAEKTKQTSESLKDSKRHSKSFAGNIRRFLPNIRMWWNLVAGILPIVISLGTAVAGLATALGAVAGAGAAFVGLGLLGHGEGIADSFALAQRRLNELKRELFRDIRPALQEFAPISERFLGTLGQRLQPLVDSLSGLTEFEDTFFNIFDGAVGWVSDLINSLVGMEGRLDSILGMLSGVGQSAISFLERMVESTDRNQNFFSNLAEMLWDVLTIIYNLSMAFSRMLIAFKPLISALKVASGFLNNTFSGVLLSIIAILGSFAYMIRIVAIAMTGQFLGSIKYAIGGMYAYISSVYTAIAATSTLLALMAATGVGLVVIGAGLAAYQNMKPDTPDSGTGGMGMGSGGSRSPTYNTTINVDGEPTKKQVKRMEDISHKVGEERDDISDRRSY